MVSERCTRESGILAAMVNDSYRSKPRMLMHRKMRSTPGSVESKNLDLVRFEVIRDHPTLGLDCSLIPDRFRIAGVRIVQANCACFRDSVREIQRDQVRLPLTHAPSQFD